MPLKDILNTDPLALTALAGLAVTILVTLILFGFVIFHLMRDKPKSKTE